jgi:hypothetical protein
VGRSAERAAVEAVQVRGFEQGRELEDDLEELALGKDHRVTQVGTGQRVAELVGGRLQLSIGGLRMTAGLVCGSAAGLPRPGYFSADRFHLDAEKASEHTRILRP